MRGCSEGQLSSCGINFCEPSAGVLCIFRFMFLIFQLLSVKGSRISVKMLSKSPAMTDACVWTVPHDRMRTMPWCSILWRWKPISLSSVACSANNLLSPRSLIAAVWIEEEIELRFRRQQQAQYVMWRDRRIFLNILSIINHLYCACHITPEVLYLYHVLVEILKEPRRKILGHHINGKMFPIVDNCSWLVVSSIFMCRLMRLTSSPVLNHLIDQCCFRKVAGHRNIVVGEIFVQHFLRDGLAIENRWDALAVKEHDLAGV